MQNLKLLNKKNLSIILLFSIFAFESSSQEPVDIWNVEVKQNTEKVAIDEKIEEKNIFKS